MMSKIETDTRLDPRIRAAFAGMNTGGAQPDVASRDELLAQELSEKGKAIYARQVALFDRMDDEAIAPSTGLAIRDLSSVSASDGITVPIRYIGPKSEAVLPCIYFAAFAAGRQYAPASGDFR